MPHSCVVQHHSCDSPMVRMKTCQSAFARANAAGSEDSLVALLPQHAMAVLLPSSLDTQSPRTIVVQHHVFDRWSAAIQILSHCFCASNGIILPTLLHASFATTHVGSATSCPSLATPRLSLQRQSPRPSVWIHFHLHSACILYLPGLPSTLP